MNDLISIIMPVYNVEKYLERALNSVINQTYTNLEIILINDGSNDNSGVLCEEMAKKDRRIKVIHQENSGVAMARNIGLKNATGKYIGFVDPDDVISNKMYEILYKAIMDNDSNIATCNYVTFMKEIPKFDEFYKAEVLTNDEAIKEIMKDKKVTSYCWDKLFDIELFKDIEFPNVKSFEDAGTIFKLFLKVDKAVHVDMNLYGYYIRDNSITGEYNMKYIMDFAKIVKYRYDILLKEKPSLCEYVNLNRVNFSTRCFLDIAKHKKIKVLNNKSFKEMLYEELEIAKKLNTREIRKLNTKKLNLLNRILFFNPYLFYFIMKIYFQVKKY